MSEFLKLKWGTLKGWKVESEAGREALKRYHEAGNVSLSAMAQGDTTEQKQAICDLIDAIEGPITNDWSGETFTKEEAKAYILEYRR